jgi:hypothetical protein
MKHLSLTLSWQERIERGVYENSSKYQKISIE